MANTINEGLPLYAAIPFDLIDDSQVDLYQLAVYTALRRHADFVKGNRCFPAIDTVAKEARCSARQVVRSLKALEASGWVTVQRGQGRGHVNHYILRLKKRCPPVTLSKGEKVTASPEKMTGTTIKGDPQSHYLNTLTKTLTKTLESPPPVAVLMPAPAEIPMSAEERIEGMKEILRLCPHPAAAPDEVAPIPWPRREKVLT